MTHSKNLLVLILLFSPVSAFAKSIHKSPLPTVLKADTVDGDRERNILNATGHVELTKDGNTLFSDKLSYDKNLERITATGNIKISNYDIGNVFATDASVSSDFKSGYFNDATIVFKDGAYIKSPKITKINESTTIFKRPIFSICPNEEIKTDNLLAGGDTDAITIQSTSTTINKETNSIKSKNGVIRFYNVPVLYTPYLSMPMPASKRKSGFLHPSYTKSTKLGFGLKLPYYFNIAPNEDLTTTTEYHPGGDHLILLNNYRHLLKDGFYNVNLEVANNRPKNNPNGTTNKETNQEIRWHGRANGDIKISDESALDFKINNVGDKNYLRDYHNDFLGSTVSEINLDRIENHDYASIKAVKTQELETNRDSTTAPTALPIINLYKEIKPAHSLFNQTYGFLVNSTTISRENGLQYRRVSGTPEIKIPYNLSGNLFEFGASMQTDFYNLENNFDGPNTSNKFNSTAFNYRPEANLKWSLPMVGKYQTNTIVIEPLINIVTGSYKNNFNKIPNEDSQSTELTQSNLFLVDRFNGFDRNEDGRRITYGAKSSLFNDKIGQFNFGLGQSWKGASKTQDVILRGFNDSNKSNIVGEIGYKSLKVFSINYNFQLNESNYRNDINEVSTALNFERFIFSSNYIVIRKTADSNESRKQLNLDAKFKITKRLMFELNNDRDLILKRNITRKYGLIYDGCCIAYGFSISEENPTAISQAQKSYNINFSIKNL